MRRVDVYVMVRLWNRGSRMIGTNMESVKGKGAQKNEGRSSLYVGQGDWMTGGMTDGRLTDWVIPLSD
jgi:hypothetical protein